MNLKNSLQKIVRDNYFNYYGNDNYDGHRFGKYNTRKLIEVKTKIKNEIKKYLSLSLDKVICTFNEQDAGKVLVIWMGREPSDITPYFNWKHK